MDNEDFEKSGQGLAETFTKFLRRFISKAVKKNDPVQLPTSDAHNEAPESQFVEPKLELPTAVAPAPELKPAKIAPPEPSSKLELPTAQTPTPHPALEMSEIFVSPGMSAKFTEIPKFTDLEPPAAIVSQAESPTLGAAARPIPQAPATPRVPVRLPEFSQIDMRRGFSADDPGGFDQLRHEQMAQAQRYDQTTDALFDAEVQKSRVDRDYRQRSYDLHLRTIKDMSNDYRRIDDLERRNECSRDTITDANI
jgi:hypothetical protein